MTTATLVHYYPYKYGDPSNEGYQKGIAIDLERGYAVKIHDHFFQDHELGKRCSCPIKLPKEMAEDTGESSEQPRTTD